MPKKIFVSHSAHRDPSALPTLNQLEDKLKRRAGAYQVLLDHSTLTLAEDWRSAINVWCGLCDAAILLITPDSMGAPYCEYEWSILGYRKATSPTFRIIPVYLRSTPEQLRGKPHQISEIQGVNFSTIDETWPKIERLLAGVGGTDSPTRTQAQLIASLLRRVINDPGSDLLKTAQSMVNLRLGTWEPLQDPWERFALQMMGLGLVKAAPALMQLRWAFENDKSAWSNVVEMVAGSWVDDRSAHRLAALSAGECSSRAVALNATAAPVCRPYVVKASRRPPSDTWLTATAPDTAADLDQLKVNIAASLSRALRLDATAGMERLASKLKIQEKIRQPVIVYLSTRSLDAAWLQELRRTFESVTFFLLAGSDRPSLAGVEWMNPELPDHFEETVWSDYDNAKEACALP